jgi:hypothetical protein
MLQEKYHTFEQLQFSLTLEQDKAFPLSQQGKQNKPIEGHTISDFLKAKNKNAILYPAFLFLALSKNLKFFYMNMDSVLLVNK